MIDRPDIDTITLTGSDQEVAYVECYENITLVADVETWFNLGDRQPLTSPGTGNFKLVAGSGITIIGVKSGIRLLRFKSIGPGNLSVVAW